MAVSVLVGLVLSAVLNEGTIKAPSLHAAEVTPIASSQQPDLTKPVIIDDVEIRSRRGAAKVAPMVELDGAEIDALGAWAIGDVLNHLDGVYGGQGDPLVLVNGLRVPLASAYYGFPPDAAVRVEVLPPEAAGIYGGRSGQAVYNLVLQPRYASLDLGGGVTLPTQGGTQAVRLNGQRGSIAGQNAQQLRLSTSHDAGLSNGDRDIRSAQGLAENPNLSLRPETVMADMGGMLTRSIGDWGTVIGFNARAGEIASTVQVGDRLYKNRSQNRSANLSLGLSGAALGWQLSAESQANLRRTQQEGVSQVDNHTLGLEVSLSASRGLFPLPAGEVMTNLSLGISQTALDVERDGEAQTKSFQSQDLRLGVNLPLIQQASEGWGRLGNLHADMSLGRQVSHGSQGEDTTMGLVWQPSSRVRLSLNWSHSLMGGVEAMRLQPITYGSPRTVYDFRRGEAVEILPLSGGNPSLTAPTTSGANLTLSLGPYSIWQVTTNFNYAQSEASKAIGSLGELTEEVQDLYPDRFIRGPDGRLIEVDFRPLNLGSSQNESLGSNLSFRLPLAELWPERFGAASTVQVRLGHNRLLRAVTQLMPGEPGRDQLHGDGGGRSRQDFQATLDLRLRGITAGLNMRWQEGHRSRRLPGVDGTDDLVRDDLVITDFRLGWQIRRNPVPAALAQGSTVPLRRSGGTEVSLEIANLFDTRPHFELGDGSPAPGYGRDRLDPMGRTVNLNLRRRF